MAPKPTKTQTPPQESVHTRRQGARREREQRRQQTVIRVIGTILGLSLLAIILGLAYEQVWLPSRPVAKLNNTTLSRKEYWDVRRQEITRNISETIKSVQRLSAISPQFAQQLGGQLLQQIPSYNQEIANIKNTSDDDVTISAWLDRELIKQQAQAMGVQASSGEIAQALYMDLFEIFPDSSAALGEVMDPTGVLSDTETLTDTEEVVEEPVAEPTPLALPSEADAIAKESQLISKLFDSYLNTLVSYGMLANLTYADFETAVRQSYEREVLADKISAQLLPDSAFTASEEPNAIETRHILFAVTDESEADAQLAEANAVLAKLRAGEDFGDLAVAESDDAATSGGGGILPTFDYTGATVEGTQMDQAIVDAVAQLQEGEISEPVRTSSGWHIVQLDRRTVASFEDQIAAERSKVFDKWLTEKRAEASVTYYPAREETPTAEPALEETTEPLPAHQLYSTPLPTEIPVEEDSTEEGAEATPTVSE